jgi:hypothetical protein
LLIFDLTISSPKFKGHLNMTRNRGIHPTYLAFNSKKERIVSSATTKNNPGCHQ